MMYTSHTVIDERAVTDFIPHRPPFVLVDALYYYDATIAISGFTVKPDTLFVRDQYFQETGMIENMAQTMALRAGILARTGNEGESGSPRIGYLAAVSQLKLLSRVAVGSLLITELEVVRDLKTFLMLRATCSCQGMAAAKAELTVYLT